MSKQEPELNEVELVARRSSRTEYVIANFVNGYAAGWHFAVSAAFKEALDIRITKKTVRKVEREVLTQGQNFYFKQGDILYNSRTAYDDFSSFLKGINPVSLQVKSSTSSGFETKNTYYINGSPVSFQKIGKSSSKEELANSFRISEQIYEAGDVTLVEYRPNQEKTSLVEVRIFTTKQDQLVALLQTGKYYEEESSSWVNFRYEGDKSEPN